MRRYVAFGALALLFASGESVRLASCDHDCRNRGYWLHQVAENNFVCKKSNYYDCRFCVHVGHDGCTGAIDPGDCLTYVNDAGGQLALQFAVKTGGTCASACGPGTPGLNKVCEATPNNATFGNMANAGLSVMTCGGGAPAETS